MNKQQILEKVLTALQGGNLDKLQAELKQELVLSQYETKASMSAIKKALPRKLLSYLKKGVSRTFQTMHYTADYKQVYTDNHMLFVPFNDVPGLPFVEEDMLKVELIERCLEIPYQEVERSVKRAEIKAAKALKIEYLLINNAVFSVALLDKVTNLVGDIILGKSLSSVQAAPYKNSIGYGTICPIMRTDKNKVVDIAEVTPSNH